MLTKNKNMLTKNILKIYRIVLFLQKYCNISKMIYSEKILMKKIIENENF